SALSQHTLAPEPILKRIFNLRRGSRRRRAARRRRLAISEGIEVSADSDAGNIDSEQSGRRGPTSTSRIQRLRHIWDLAIVGLLVRVVVAPYTSHSLDV